jgi:WD40 repeat protein
MSIINNKLDRVMIRSTDSMLYVRDIQTDDVILTLEKNNNPIKSLVFNPDKIMIAPESTDSTLYIKDVQTGDIIITLEGHNGPMQ